MLVSENVLNIMGGKGFGDMREVFPRITAPTLILKADADEANRQQHQELAALLPNGRLVHIDGAGQRPRFVPEGTARKEPELAGAP